MAARHFPAGRCAAKTPQLFNGLKAVRDICNDERRGLDNLSLTISREKETP